MRTPLILILLSFAFASCKKEEATPQVAPAPRAAGPRTIAMEVTGDGFVPANLTVKSGEPLKLVVTRKTDETCATDLLIDGTDIKVALPLDKPVEVAWTPTRAGKVKFGCAMDMMVGGVLLVE